MSTTVYTSCTNAGPISVYVKDGKVVRIRPLVVDESELRPWTIEAGGHRYSPPKKFNVAPFVMAERNRLYSDDRIKYPLKRVNFDPNGDRNTESRGRVGYERISWDEALDIVARANFLQYPMSRFWPRTSYSIIQVAQDEGSEC